MDTQTIQKGIGESIPTFFMSVATVLAGFIMEFTTRLGAYLYLMGALPFIACAGGLFRLCFGWHQTFFAYVLAGIKHLSEGLISIPVEYVWRWENHGKRQI